MAEQLDDQRLARLGGIALPIVTVVTALGVGVSVGPSTAILVLAGGLLLGVIALFWGSIRILSGDAAISPELEALELSTRGGDPLAARKKMLLRALKDLENEHSLGKLDEDDYLPIAANYRAELKTVLRRIDESIAPHRERAEELAREHLIKAGLLEEAAAEQDRPESPDAEEEKASDRVICPKCTASNEPDAKFCKECATRLAKEEAVDEA